jgi:hypothetical protein
MKTIQPVSIWYNGKTDTATIFSLTCINDNLKDSATFYYQLFDASLVQLAQGNLTMTLPDYSTDWTTNDAAYNWAATQLSLVITGNYSAPVAA